MTTGIGERRIMPWTVYPAAGGSQYSMTQQLTTNPAEYDAVSFSLNHHKEWV
jgi:hypothetical protein